MRQAVEWKRGVSNVYVYLKAARKSQQMRVREQKLIRCLQSESTNDMYMVKVIPRELTIYKLYFNHALRSPRPQIFLFHALLPLRFQTVLSS